MSISLTHCVTTSTYSPEPATSQPGKSWVHTMPTHAVISWETHLQGEHEVELHAVLIQNANAHQPAEERIALKQALGVLVGDDSDTVGELTNSPKVTG